VISGFTLTSAALSEIDNHSVLLQTGFWAAVKSLSGQTPFAFHLSHPQIGENIPFLVLVRKLTKRLSLAYVPHGPLLSSSFEDGPFAPFPAAGPTAGEELLVTLSKQLREYLPKSTVFIRYDLPWLKSTIGPSFRKPLRKAAAAIQPESTVIVDIAPNEDDILAAMKSKTRYNIKLASRKGVTVREAEPGELPEWYKLYEETARRDRITIHDFGYYKELFVLAESYRGAPELGLLFAELEGELLAGIIVCFHNKGATYLYGASSSEKRNVMPNYALQWRAMELAKERGCLWYDLFGIPPHAEKGHPLHGLYRFKTGFGGSVLHRPGCWDVPLKPALYSGYRAAEQARNYYYKTVRKR
jgi:lipid II:glycine glycyltransferase (peptidoglycan interpeptide bridge formation enzyme)